MECLEEFEKAKNLEDYYKIVGCTELSTVSFLAQKNIFNIKDVGCLILVQSINTIINLSH